MAAQRRAMVSQISVHSPEDVFVDRPGAPGYYAPGSGRQVRRLEEGELSRAFFNREARVLHDGAEYGFSEEDFEKLDSPGNYWHHRTDPSSWLCASVVLHAKIKFRGRLPRAVLIRLCADTLNITEGKLEDSLDWNANYMAFHDGGTAEEHHVYPGNSTPQ